MEKARVLFLSFSLLGALTTPAGAEVPTFAEVAGHEFGERITVHAEMVRYLERLAETSDRVELLEQGESWEGRRLLAAVITAPENHARLGEIQTRARRLADPRSTSPEEAREIAASQPAVVWLGGSIHGFELSGSEGLLKLTEHLTTRDDPATLGVLRDLVVIVDPMLNPDGRDAFAHANHRALGARPNPRRDDWTNDYDLWDALAFRTGHYFFDTNRDWFAHTQAETRGRVPTLLAWRPQVVIDAHEMGPDVEFYFDPAAEPYGSYFPAFARRWFERFHRAYAAAFDAAGFEYMSRERYNYFYPGYTTSYGSYQGAVGMLYEQGSSRGLALERADESVRTLGDALEQQYTAAWTALATAAAAREELLLDYYRARREAVEDGRRGTRRYLLPSGGDPLHRRELVELLGRNGIEVGVLTEEVTLSGLTDRAGEAAGERSFAVGTYVVEAAQPKNRLVRALLEPDQPLPEDFLAEARARLERDENPRFYDVTGWSLPLLFDLPAYGSSDARNLPTRPAGEAQAAEPPGEAGYAYLIDGRQAAALAALAHLKVLGHRAAVTLAPVTVGGRSFASGTVVLRVGQNGEGLHGDVLELARRFGLEVAAVGTGLADRAAGGNDPAPEDTAGRPPLATLGSGDVLPVRQARVALLAGPPVHAYSFGWAWYVLDRQYEIPLTVRRVGSVPETPLADFDVLVIPDLFSAKGLAEALGEPGRERLSRWVKEGGTLVAIGAAVDFVRDLELVHLGSWYPETEEGEEEKAATAEPEPYRFTVPGAILGVELDPGSWLAAGYEGVLPALVTSDRIYTAPQGPPKSGRRVVGRYAAGEELLLSGHAWKESLERLPGAVYLYDEKVGQGRVVAFAEDPNFRAFHRGTDRLFLNAVVLGPSAP